MRGRSSTSAVLILKPAGLMRRVGLRDGSESVSAPLSLVIHPPIRAFLGPASFFLFFIFHVEIR